MRSSMWILWPARAEHRFLVDDCQIDLGLLGSQKVLSLMADLAMVSVSARAWERCAAVNYVGYDALLPWQHAMTQQIGRAHV